MSVPGVRLQEEDAIKAEKNFRQSWDKSFLLSVVTNVIC